jgi:late competence protein required for DNA uptake (superfamily II DNA/RNA helicase)
LEREAIAGAVSVTVQGTPTRVMTAEHLVAIALRTGRAKDHARIVQFLEQEAVNVSELRKVLERHNLTSKWNEFDRKYLGDIHE